MSDEETLHVFEWAPPSAGLHAPPDGTPLAERVAAVAEDRGATAADVARRVAREAHGWLSGPDAPDAGAADALEHELAEVSRTHGWRAPVAALLGGLARAAASASRPGAPDHAAREAMADECALWIGERAEERLPSRERCAAPLLDGALGLVEGETILVHGWSETVARGIEFARARGLSPEVVVSEGGADLGGRRLARRLVAGGIPVTFIYDAAIAGAVEEVDRVWLGSDAVGPEAFVGRVGVRALLERARDADVDAVLLATSDKFVQAARPELPAWSAEERWHLWEGAPDSVDVRAQAFERAPLDLVRAVATEDGALAPSAVRARVAGAARVPSPA